MIQGREEDVVDVSLFQKFLIQIAKKDYKKAQPIAEQILVLEPKNAMILAYKKVLQQRIEQLDAAESIEEEFEDETEEDTEDEVSDD